MRAFAAALALALTAAGAAHADPTVQLYHDGGVASTTNPLPTVPGTSAAIGITPGASTAAEAGHVLKASAGALYSVYACSLTATAGWLDVVNAATVPADGAVTPSEAVYLPPSGCAQVDYGSGPPDIFSTGISAFVSSNASPLTKTTGVITAVFSWRVQ